MSRQRDEWEEAADNVFGFPGGYAKEDWDAEAAARFAELNGRVLTEDELDSLPAPTPIVADWLFKDALSWLQGKWGQGKSFVALDLAMCLATGTDWHGFTVTQTEVLYIIAEGAAGMAGRKNAWKQANGYAGKKIPGITFLPVPVQLADPDGIDMGAMRKLMDARRPGLVIVDTQARATVGADENSSRDMGKFVHGLESLRMEYGASILIVHHEPRNGDNLRGSVALEGAAESIIRSSKDGNTIKVECVKQKNVPEQDPFDLTLWAIGESATLMDNVPGARDENTPTMAAILDTLMNTVGYRLSSSALMAASEVAQGSFYRAAKKLVDQGKVRHEQVGRSAYYSIPECDRPTP